METVITAIVTILLLVIAVKVLAGILTRVAKNMMQAGNPLAVRIGGRLILAVCIVVSGVLTFIVNCWMAEKAPKKEEAHDHLCRYNEDDYGYVNGRDSYIDY